MKSTTKISALSLLGFLHWFFGNLYEAIVLSPNMWWADSQSAMLENIRQVFHISAPYYYYLPWSPLSLLLVFYLFFHVRHHPNPLLKKWVGVAMATAIVAGALTYYIIVTFNLTLWVGHGPVSAPRLASMVRASFWVGTARMLVVAATAYSLYRCLRLSIRQSN